MPDGSSLLDWKRLRGAWKRGNGTGAALSRDAAVAVRIFMQEWYVATTKPGEGNRAAEHLSRQGFETYLPKVPTKKGGTPVPYIPGYIFVLVQDRYFPPSGTRGMGRLLGSPTPLRPGTMEKFMKACSEAADDMGLDEQLRVLVRGEKVTTEIGGERLHGRVAWQSGDRVAAVFRLLGREVLVRVPRRKVEV